MIFDSVSRMSRNADEGFNLYQDLFNKGLNLIFLKEHHIDTAIYKQALETKQIDIEIHTDSETMNEFTNALFDIVNKLLMNLVKEQIKRAFEDAENEVKKLHKRTSEGLVTAKLNGKRVGLEKGSTLTIKKSIKAKQDIPNIPKTLTERLMMRSVSNLLIYLVTISINTNEN